MGLGRRPALDRRLRRTSLAEVRTLVATLLLVALTGCGADVASVAETGTPVTPPTTAVDPTEPAEPTEPADLGDDPLATLTGDEICAALPVDAASLAIGSEVAQAEAAGTGTPQCAYTYGGDSASLATFTVAAQRPEDVGGRGLQDAFDLVVAANRTVAAEDATRTPEEAEVAAGDRALRLSSDTLTLCVVASAGHLLTVVTTPDLDTTAVEALCVATADAVA